MLENVPAQELIDFILFAHFSDLLAELQIFPYHLVLAQELLHQIILHLVKFKKGEAHGNSLKDLI